ncbi:unnamed protein product [Rhizoctonia solani]|nr:unnamed protein product [Rhizoctonia solani]
MLGLDLSGTGPLHILSETNEMDGDSAECTDDLLSIRGLIDGIDTEIGLLEKTERLCEVALGTCKPGCWRGKLDMGEMEPTEGREPGRTVLGSCEAGKIRPGSIAVDPDMMEEMDSRRERKLDGLWPGHVKSGGDMVENTVEATEDMWVDSASPRRASAMRFGGDTASGMDSIVEGVTRSTWMPMLGAVGREGEIVSDEASIDDILPVLHARMQCRRCNLYLNTLTLVRLGLGLASSL